MSSPTHSRRFAAVLHSDLAGYVRLMAGAEDRTVSRLKAVRADVWRPAVEAAGGRIVNIVADSVLAEFSSAGAAVAAAADVQRRMARFNEALDREQRLMFRIGLHQGEVIFDETETIFGDTVNIAARVQLMAEPGGIAASAAIRDAAHLQIGHVFIDGGRHQAKHVSRPLKIYHVRIRETAQRPLSRAARWIRRAGVTIRRPVLWGVVATAALLIVGGGYLAFTAETARLQHWLAEQTRQSTQREAEIRRRADAELETARQERQKAKRELALLQADIEARRRQAELDSRAAAIRTATAVPASFEEAAIAESRLGLESADRQRLQIALTSLGFDTHGDDGVFGPRSREMIARWQKAHDQRATGFMTGAQQQALLKEATLAKYDEPPANVPPESADGLWRGTYECGRKGNGNAAPFTLKPEIRLKGRTGTWDTANASWTNDQTLGISVSIDGTSVLVKRRRLVGSENMGTTPLVGRLSGNSIQASNTVCTMELMRDASL